MSEEDGIDWDELDRRHKAGDVEYQIIETIKAGTRAARCLQHPLDRYLARETIEQRQYDAGMILYKDWTMAQMAPSLPSYDGTPAPEGYNSRSINDTQLDASRAYTQALIQVGKRASLVLTDIVLCELTAEQHGARVGQTRLQAIGSLKLALDMLADHHKLPRDK